MSDMTHAALVFPIFEGEGKIVLSRRALHKRLGGCYSPPAGSVERNETPRQGGVRELREESGLEVDESRLEPMGRLVAMGPDGQLCGGWLFLLRLHPGEQLMHTEKKKHGPWAAYTYEQALQLVLPPVTKEIIQALAAGAGARARAA